MRTVLGFYPLYTLPFSAPLRAQFKDCNRYSAQTNAVLFFIKA